MINDSKQSFHSKGGKARAANMTAEERSAQASDAATARWARAGARIKKSQHAVLVALIDKFPPFDSGWGEPMRQQWFNEYAKLMEMVQKDLVQKDSNECQKS